MSAPHKIRTTEITSEPSSRAEYKAEGVRSHHQRIISDNRTLSHISEARRCPSSTPRVSLSIYLSIASQRVLLDEGRAAIGASMAELCTEGAGSVHAIACVWLARDAVSLTTYYG